MGPIKQQEVQEDENAKGFPTRWALGVMTMTNQH
jgi:hypothetical protein